MAVAESLSNIAQLGVGLAGFSGVAIVLSHGGGELLRFERYRIGVMLGTTLGSTFLALLPLVVVELGPGQEEAFRMASGVMAAFTAGFIAYFFAAVRHMRAKMPELFSPTAAFAVMAGHAANLLLQVSSVTGLQQAAVGAYLAGLYWLLAHGAYQYWRILFIRPRRSPFAGRDGEVQGGAPQVPGDDGSDRSR